MARQNNNNPKPEDKEAKDAEGTEETQETEGTEATAEGTTQTPANVQVVISQEMNTRAATLSQLLGISKKLYIEQAIADKLTADEAEFEGLQDFLNKMKLAGEARKAKG